MEACDKHLDNALLLAAAKGNTEVVEILLRRDCHPNNVNLYDQTPLVKTCIHQHPDIVILLFDSTTAGDWDRVAAVERLPALHYSVDFIFLSFGIMGFIVELYNY